MGFDTLRMGICGRAGYAMIYRLFPAIVLVTVLVIGT